MAKGQLTGVLQCLRRTALLSEGAAQTDGDLLARYLEDRDEAAFESLLKRHGAMVLGVCRRILRNEADAHDAFQATFLVFLRKAGSIVPRALVGNWLYGVAHKTSLKAKAMNRQRNVKERQRAAGHHGQARDPAGQELQALLDEALSHLPDKYRSAIVLCELEGKSLKEAAQRLGCPPGTIASRLARARGMLASRLARRGLSLSVGALALALAQEAAATSLPRSLFVSTAKAALVIATGQTALLGTVSPKVMALAEGMVKTMLLAKLKWIPIAMATVIVLGAGGTLLPYQVLAAEKNQNEPKVPALVVAKADEQARAENYQQGKKVEPEEKTYGFLGITLMNNLERGTAFVREVFPNSPAARAGVKVEDMVLEIGDVPVKEPSSAIETLKRWKPGDEVTIRLMRGQNEMDVTVALGPWPAEMSDTGKAKVKDSPPAEAATGYLGLVLRGDKDMNTVTVESVAPESPAAKTGVKAEDILLTVNQVKAKDPQGVINQLSNLKVGDKVSLRIKRGGKEMELSITAAKRPADFQPM